MKKLSSILLVDDDATTNYLNESLLRSLHVADQLIIAQDGLEALALLENECAAPSTSCPALILLDVNMPAMNGMEFLEAYQRLPRAHQEGIIIVVLTTSMNSTDLARLNELPIAGMASKPLTEEKINTILQLHFQRQLPTAEGLAS
ncbi:response regulator [Hymenobacter sp. BRD128]|uniref:response regulator n=1 Tax=Hymenobacter sp. BRD128 TaxID=2675878 RepID=UPI0015647FD8|nr:response regulator [Hymenobacter sp. BRD128]QKG58446.1 response regulator [Hymenobacter sp. BRD128]